MVNVVKDRKKMIKFVFHYYQIFTVCMSSENCVVRPKEGPQSDTGQTNISM